MVHPFVHVAVVASSLGPWLTRGLEMPPLAERVRFLSRLLKYEFIFRADAAFDVNFERTVESLCDSGDLIHDVDGILRPSGHDGRQILLTYASLIDNFIESYLIMVRTLRGLELDRELSDKDLVKAAMTTGERMYLVGEIERREARGKVNFFNAIRAFSDMGLVTSTEGRQYRLADRRRIKAQLLRLERRIASYLNNR